MNRLSIIVFLGLFALSASGCKEVAKRAMKAGKKGTRGVTEAVPPKSANRTKAKKTPKRGSEKGKTAFDVGKNALVHKKRDGKKRKGTAGKRGKKGLRGLGSPPHSGKR